MKIRAGFVTNSSSSSYICISKLNSFEELQKYMAEEYGKFGTRLLKENVVTGKDVKTGDNDFYDDWLEISADYMKELLEGAGVFDNLSDDDLVVGATFISYSTEGDEEGEDAFLYNAIPSEFKESIYIGDDD